jgi:hypothetical protein
MKMASTSTENRRFPAQYQLHAIFLLGGGPTAHEFVRNKWPSAELQAKNEEWQLVCTNVFGFQWSQ